MEFGKFLGEAGHIDNILPLNADSDETDQGMAHGSLLELKSVLLAPQFCSSTNLGEHPSMHELTGHGLRFWFLQLPREPQ